MQRLKNIIVVGLFWGDEGKAKIVDLLTENARVVARYQGGANAGHSVEVAGKRFVLHQVPTGILHPDKICVLGAGMVIDFPKILDELYGLEKLGIDWHGRLRISPRANLVLPYHKLVEEIEERKRGIGTTKRGIGPAYRDKAARINVRIGEIGLGKVHLVKRLDNWLDEMGTLYEKSYEIEFPSAEKVADELIRVHDILGDSVHEVSSFLAEIARTTGGVLAEGAQGSMLSLNWGTYPFVTSSETTANGVGEGLGMDMRLFDEVVGLAKAFCTRVGNGPFPTEADVQTQAKLRGTGEHTYDEFGSTTGRPRRCGWFDAVVLRYVATINGLDAIALTKLDCLTGIEPLKIAVEYEGSKTFPATIAEIERVVPVYRELPGWHEDISQIHNFKKLPDAAQDYVRAIEEIANKPVKYIGVGPGREDIIIIDD